MEIAELKDKTVAELQSCARALKIPHFQTLRKPDLIVRICRRMAEQSRAPTATGVLDILSDGYGFLRSSTWSYLAGPNDIYVNPRQIASFGLRAGDTVTGDVRPPARTERYLALAGVTRINGLDASEALDRPHFQELRPLYPQKRLTLETPGGPMDTRLIDLIAPVGLGQRGLIVSPPKAGKTTILRNMAQAIIANHPNTDLVVMLIDERPEEVTEMEAAIGNADRAVVVASTFDEAAKRQVKVAEMAMEQAKRRVEHGRNVVVLLDSVTRLARAYNIVAPQSGRILSGGVAARGLAKPKRFFGSARNINQGGSLTVIATALIDTGSRMDEVIFEEFKGTGNMELVLSREAADLRIFPAIDLHRSGTRREELLLSRTELNRVFLLRNFLADMPTPDAIEFLAQRLRLHDTNQKFLDAMAQGA